jgi:NAD(P)-dependent dehydrogenase (short-subunit alcohol dehydrogenase family)
MNNVEDMNILILGAAGQIGRIVTDMLLRQTDAKLILFARDATKRLKLADAQRVRLVDGSFTDSERLKALMKGIDIVYINAMGDKKAMLSIADAMKAAGVRRMIGATILGIYDEVPGAFGNWNRRMVGHARIRQVADATSVFETDAFDYTLLRLTWLYDQEGNTNYMVTQKGEPFVGAQVTRQAVAQLIVDIVSARDNRFIKKSLGVSEPDTNWDKPSFY